MFSDRRDALETIPLPSVNGETTEEPLVGDSRGSVFDIGMSTESWDRIPGGTIGVAMTLAVCTMAIFISSKLQTEIRSCLDEKIMSY